MIFRISFLLFFLLIVPAAFIYAKKVRKKSRLCKALFLLPNIVLLALTFYYMFNDGRIDKNADSIGIYLLATLLVSIPELIYSIMLGISLLFKSKKARNILTKTGLGLAFIPAVIIIVGYISCFTVVNVESHDFTSPDLPEAFNGYKIVQVSDLHLGTYHLHPGTVDRIVKKINEQQGDVIFFTGDLVNFSPDEIKQFHSKLKQLHAPDGVFSVLGNHDYLQYIHYKEPSQRLNGMEELKSLQREAGWDLLLNESRVIRRGTDSIYIIGSENDGTPPFPAEGDLQKALKNVPDSSFKILLSHDPTQWKRKVLPKTNIQLTLSGHTHAGQFKVFGHSPSSLVYDEWNGMYNHGPHSLFISSGIGEALIPFRFGAWPKIDIITLHSAQ